jgi:hypothetical protein
VIKGEIDNFKDNKDDYFNVSLLSVKDSAFIDGGTFTNGIFNIELKNIEEKQFILRINSVEYAAKDTVVYIEDSYTDVGNIYLKIRELNEVTVTAKMPVLTHKSGVMRLDIRNSFLQDAGNLVDILKKTPGLSVDDHGNIEILGKGSPTVYINDKEVRSPEELSALSSRDIDNVEIDRNPSAEHNASGFAVVRIKTRKKIQDFLGMEVSNRAMFGRRFSDRINFNISAKSKKISNYFTYSFNDGSFLQYDKASDSIFRTGGNYSKQRETDLSLKSKYHSIFYSMDYDLNAKNVLGFQYLGNFGTTNQTSISDQTIEEFGRNTELRHIHVLSEETNNLHNLSLNYKLILNAKNTFVVISDYSFSNAKKHQDITEKNRGAVLQTESVSGYNDNFSVFGIKAELSSEIAGINSKAGVKYASIDDKGWYELDRERHSSHVSDNATALYISATKSFGTFSVTAGIRGEYTGTRVGTSEGKENEVDTNYYNLFPNVKIIKNISENSDLSFSYSRRITRPGFSQISPRFTYIDSLSNMIGNPRLLPAFSDVAELSYRFSNISFTIGYTKRSRFIANIMTTASQESNIIQYTYTNLKKAEYWIGNVEYSFSKSNFTGYGGIYFYKPFVNIDFLGQQRKLRKPLTILQVHFDYSVQKNTSLYGTLDYQSAGEYETLYKYQWTHVTLGIRRYLMNKKLRISLECRDIFKTYTPNSWKNQFGNIVSTMRTNGDTRMGILSISYDFGNLKRKNSQSSTEEERNRL